jgi:hypothetical protein
MRRLLTIDIRRTTPLRDAATSVTLHLVAACSSTFQSNFRFDPRFAH